MALKNMYAAPSQSSCEAANLPEAPCVYVHIHTVVVTQILVFKGNCC